MASYFILELDTTNPMISIFAPNYTDKENLVEIRVVGNEPLGGYHSIYAIDANGIRYDFIFEHNGNEFIGQVRFNDFPFGIATIYAQVHDEVGNNSNLASKTILVLETVEALELELTLAELIMENIVSDSAMMNRYIINQTIMPVRIGDLKLSNSHSIDSKERDLILREKARKITVRTEVIDSG